MSRFLMVHCVVVVVCSRNNAIENAILYGKNMQYAHFAEIRKKRQYAKYAAIAYLDKTNICN